MFIHLRKNFLFKLINYMKVRKVDVRIGVKLMSFYRGNFFYGGKTIIRQNQLCEDFFSLFKAVIFVIKISPSCH